MLLPRDQLALECPLNRGNSSHYGTGAEQFSNFLQQRASNVKLGLSFLFLALGGWLIVSLFL